MRPRLLNSLSGVSLLLLICGLSEGAQAQATYSKGVSKAPFAEEGGQALYRAICQGCHMADGRGAKGAGAYPALANNPKLRSAAYPLSVVANGQKAMPWFGGALTDGQIAEVVAYVRTHFNNHFEGPIQTQDVAAVRRPRPDDE